MEKTMQADGRKLSLFTALCSPEKPVLKGAILVPAIVKLEQWHVLRPQHLGLFCLACFCYRKT
jgi:hypothetical protein